MPTTRVLGGVAMAAAVIGLTVPNASASDISDAWVTPYYAVPGMRLTVTTTACGPDANYSKGQSEAGGQVNLLPLGRSGLLAGTFRVPKHTRPGWYTVTLRCPPRTQTTASFRVVRGPAHGFSGLDRGFSGLECDDDFGPVGRRSSGR
ncbi:sortase [Actinacidiphila glaucinigra]|uniref:sortase n=1 Tax=Actinacidiphila glaucinigra TaxID=235986 RepID=UPI0033B7D05B